MAEGFNPPGLWGPTGPGFSYFSQGFVQPEGRVVHVTGQVAWDAERNIVGPGDIRAQFACCLAHVETILDAVGGRLEDVVSMTTYFIDRADLPALQEERAKHFKAPIAPASILIQVAGLVDPAMRVELAPIAVVPHHRFVEPVGSSG